ncbi:hypothetical protein ACFL5X_02170 [Candidatus Omnitrophota bacterium]
MQKRKKKEYRKPVLAKVDLTIEDAVLACCKTSSPANSAGGKRLCSTSQCISAQVNFT